MYGLIHHAIREVVQNHCGAAAWEEVLQNAGYPGEVFQAHGSYPDEMTLALVGSGAGKCAIEPEEFLREAGRSWMKCVTEYGFGEFLDAAGKDPAAMLTNLDALHARVMAHMPGIEPPEFEFSRISDDEFELEYRSHRAGLLPLLEGLLEGVGRHFSRPLEFELVRQGSDEEPSAVYHVRVCAAEPAPK